MSLPIFVYRVEYSVLADLFIGGCLLATTLAYLTVRRTHRSAPSTYSNRRREIAVAKVLSVCGIAGCLLLLVDARTNGIQISANYLLNNLGSIRSAVFERLANSTEPSKLATVGSYLTACSFLSIIAAVRLGRTGGRSLIVLGGLNLALVGAVSVFVYGGRASFFYAGLLILVAMYLGGWRFSALNPKTVLLGSLTALTVWYFSVSWLATREGAINTEAVLSETQHARFHPWIASSVRSNSGAQHALISLGYFSSPLPTLSFYLQQDVPGPFFGGYSYPLPARTLSKIAGTNDPQQWLKMRKRVFAPLESAGYFGNVWATWLRDLLVDFGYVGALLFCGIFGAFMAWSRNKFETTGALHYHCLDVIGCFTLGFGAFTSVLWFTFLSNAFFIGVLLMLAVRVRLSTSVKPAIAG